MWEWIQKNPDLVGNLLTLLTIAGGAIGVIWKIGSEYRKSLQLQKQNAREALKLEIYRTFTAKQRRATETNVEAATYALTIQYNIKSYQEDKKNGVPTPPISDRASKFNELHLAAHFALVELIQEFETWSIVFPERELFQTALNSANHDAQEAYIPLSSFLNLFLPNDFRPDIDSLLNDESLTELDQHAASYRRAMEEIGGYLTDLQNEAQRRLLGELFDNEVPVRKPLDPSYQVLSTEPAEMEKLMSYFLNDTAWGKDLKQHEAALTRPDSEG